MIIWQLILYVIPNALFYSLLAVGFGFTLRSVKFFNISYGGSFLIGGYIMFLFYRTLNFSFILALLISLFASGLYLALSYKLIFSSLLRQKAKNLTLLIASFGLLIATSATLGIIFGSQTMVITRHLDDIGLINIFDATLNTVEALSVLFIFIIIFIFAYIRYKTRFGRATRAIEDDNEVAELVGIPKSKIFLQTFFISGVLAGLAGIIKGLDVGIIPSSGLLFMFPAIVATVVGGMRSFWGGILGAFILAILEQLTIVYFGGSWIQAVPFVVLIILLFVKPNGILKK